MSQRQYRTVAREGVHEVEIGRSRFLCAIAPAGSEREARDFVQRVREAHPDATHHCFAYVIGADGGVQRSSDDGEPGGTAGLPMLRMLLRRDIRYAVAVVTRYFGGVKLGAGGLARAYGGVVGEALDAVGTVVRQRFRLVTVTVGHARAGRLENDLRSTGHTVRGVLHGEAVRIEVAVPEADLPGFREWLAAATAGTARLETGGEAYADV